MKILTPDEMRRRLAEEIVDKVDELKVTARAFGADAPLIPGLSAIDFACTEVLGCITGSNGALPAFRLVPVDNETGETYVDDVRDELWPMEPISTMGLSSDMMAHSRSKQVRPDQISEVFTENISHHIDDLAADPSLDKSQALEKLGEHVAKTIDRFNGYVQNSHNRADTPHSPVITGANLVNRGEDVYAANNGENVYVAGEFADDYRRARVRARQARLRSIENGKGEDTPTIV